MEKFGIFELLDTLSALSAAKNDFTRAPEDAKGEEKTESLPPVSAQTAPPAPLSRTEREQNALNDFFARHERISKKIDETK